jgi:HSP20 family protein
MSTLVRWEPFRELASMQGDMNRWLNTFFDGQTRETRNWVPALDVWETDNDVVYAFDLPGIPEDKISIEVKDDTLTVSADRERHEETSEDGFYRFERRYGTFTRTIALPQGVDESAIKADYKDGVLELHVTKPAQSKPRRIEIGGTEQPTIEGTATEA